MRLLLPVAALLVAAGLAVLLALELGEADQPSDGVAPAVRDRAAADPILVGTGVEAPTPPAARDTTYDDVTDVKTLVLASYRNSPAQDRLVSLAQRRSGVVLELIDWLRPEHDGEREPAWSRTVSTNAVLLPGLFSLRYTLKRLAPASVLPLAEALADEDPEFRRRVAQCLALIGPDAAEAAGALTARLEPGREDVRGQVSMLQALGMIGEGAREALPYFHAYVRDAELPDEARAEAAAWFLAVAGPTPEVLETCAVALRDQSYEVCRALLPSVVALGEEGAALRGELLAIAQDPGAHDVVRMEVIRALGGMTDAEGRARGALIDIALDADELDRTRAHAMWSVAKQGKDGLDALLGAFGAADEETRLLVVSSLTSEDGPVAPGRLRAFLDPLRGAEYEADREKAVYVGARTGGDTPALVRWLSRWLDDGDAGVRDRVVRSLTSLRDDSGAVVEALLEAARDEDAELRHAVVGALAERASNALGDESFLRRVEVADLAASMLRVEDDDCRETAATLLHYVAPERDLEALHVWTAVLEEGRWPALACAVLSGLGPKAKDAIPVVERALEACENDSYWAQRLRRTLEAIRPR